MFKLTCKELRNDHFRMTMVKLANCDEYEDYKVVYNIMRMAKSLEKELARTQREWVTLAAKYVQIDEKGKFKTDESGELVWNEGIDVAAAKAAIEAFGDTVIEINRFKLKLSDIAPAKLSPAELSTIEPLLADMEDAPTILTSIPTGSASELNPQ